MSTNWAAVSGSLHAGTFLAAFPGEHGNFGVVVALSTLPEIVICPSVGLLRSIQMTKNLKFQAPRI